MNKNSARVFVFMDLDGTITRKDTMFAFIRYCYPGFNYFTGLASISPVLFLNRIGAYPSEKAKEILLMKFFRGKNLTEIKAKGDEFALSILPDLVRKKAFKEIELHKKSGASIIVVTASLSLWCEAWCKQNGMDIIATEYETADGRMTGKLQGNNCKGIEKVNRIKEKYSIESADKIYAYGDSKSDLNMLDLADVKYYKWKIIK